MEVKMTQTLKAGDFTGLAKDHLQHRPGAWHSVNDLRVKLGPEKFDAFLAFVGQRIAGLQVIEATYLTRAWSARRKG
ncbi:hypothetical protein pfor_3c0290 [Rhodobacteraceae bacterium SB2]|nr:hypothetical protein pfor_3c0290 [Rhodobacteraceae bacterium SB2]